jgi:hypothetical protein
VEKAEFRERFRRFLRGQLGREYFESNREIEVESGEKREERKSKLSAVDERTYRRGDGQLTSMTRKGGQI